MSDAQTCAAPPTIGVGALVLLAPCLAVLPPIYYWLSYIWTQGLFGGIGAAVLTPFISLLLLFVALRRGLESKSRVHSSFAIPVQTGCCLLSIVVFALSPELSSLLILIVLIWPLWALSWIDSVFGKAYRIQVTFPILFLWFVLPFEPYLFNVIDTPLQEITTDVSVGLLNFFGYEVEYWNAHSFYSKDFYIIVDETCSGMNILVTLAMYAVVFGWATKRSLGESFVLCLSVIPFALLSNGLRVSAIYLLGLYGGEAEANGFWHEGSGILAFMPTLLGIYMLGEFMRVRRFRAARTPKHKSPK